MSEDVNVNVQESVEEEIAMDTMPEASAHREASQRNQRYQGYDVETTRKKRKKKKKPWFFKTMFLSILISLVVIVGVCAVLMIDKKKTQDYLTSINEANTIENILAGHDNVRIDRSFSHLAEQEDYSDTRYLRFDKDEDLDSYYKLAGTTEDYKEVINARQLYRNNDSYSTYFGLPGDLYEKFCLTSVENDIFRTDGTEKIVAQNETDSVISITANIDVKAGDVYNTKFGFDEGTVVQRIMMIDKDSLVITSVSDTVDEEEFESYNLNYDVEWKKPKFFKTLSRKSNTRKCFVYYDFGGEHEEKYTFTVPYDVYFRLPESEDYMVYMNQDCTREFTNFQFEIQNPTGSMTLYMQNKTTGAEEN